MSNTSIWFENLRERWIRKEIESIQHLFAQNIKYYEDENSDAMTSWDEIKQVWEEIKDQNIHKIQNTLVTGGDKTGTCYCDLKYADIKNNNFYYKCKLNVILNDRGEAVEFRQLCVSVEDIKDQFKKDGYLHIFEWTDAPNTVYEEHEHRGRTAFYIVRGSVTFTSGFDKTFKAGERFDVPPGIKHTAIVGPEGCDWIVAEDIEGDS